MKKNGAAAGEEGVTAQALIQALAAQRDNAMNALANVQALLSDAHTRNRELQAMLDAMDEQKVEPKVVSRATTHKHRPAEPSTLS